LILESKFISTIAIGAGDGGIDWGVAT